MFSLRANDGSHNTDVVISINLENIFDEHPVLTIHSPLNIVEELPVNTSLGGLYYVTDRDEGDTLSYSLAGLFSLLP